MGFIIGIAKRILKLALFVGIFIATIVLIPNLPPYTKFTSIKLEAPLPRTGPLANNGALNNAEKLFTDKLLGPEAFQILDGEVYTSLATGEIVKVSSAGHVTFVTKIGQPCSGLTQEHICGRPLGFQIDSQKRLLYVADAYHGIWKVDLKNDKKQLLVSPHKEINGRRPRLFNSIALQKNGDLFWTDSTSDYQLKDGVYSMISDPTGRLFSYNAAKNESKVLLDKLWFANGLAVSPDNQFIVVAETCSFRLIKYYIDGPKKGKSEVFVSGLPGTPDNIRPLPDGSGILVGLYTVYDEQNPLLIRSLTETPVIRKFVARLMRLVELPFEFLNTHYPHVMFEDILHYIGHFSTASAFVPKLSGLVAINWNGQIIESYYNTDQSLLHISDAIVVNDKLYLGSPNTQNFIAAVPAPAFLKKAFAPSKSLPPPKPTETVNKEIPRQKVESEKVKQKAGTQKPKPVETPKPVEAPKPVVTPKPVEKPKPVVTPKPVETPKPKVEEKKEAPKISKPPTPTATPKPTTTPKPTAAPKVESKPTTPPPKSAEQIKPKPKAPENKPKLSTPEPKMEEKVKSKSEEKKNESPKPSAGKVKPIIEDIPSDTAKPTRETLKVIKKEGPTEIPNHNNV